MKKLLLPLASLLFACQGHSADNYTVTAPLPADFNECEAVIVDYNTGDTLSVATVANGNVLFTGNVEKPVFARINVAGNRLGMFILEPGKIVFDEHQDARGTELNNRLTAISDTLTTLVQMFRELPDSLAEVRGPAIEEQYIAVMNRAVENNADNPVGFYFFYQQALEMDKAELTAALERYPQFGEYQRVKNLLASFQRMESTSEGNRFVDFEVTQPDGCVARLSDYAGKGDWLLVDFWASWCGPCIRETRVIKDLLSQHGDKLKVLGVAVWDEVENTQGAIERLQLPWPQILDAQSIPTDLYGIMSIPCIILIDPQGNIVSRGAQGDDLRAAVAAALTE